jgi:hypothetical protein
LARKWWAAHIEQIDRERCRQWRQLNEWMTSGITTLTLFVRGLTTTLHTHLDWVELEPCRAYRDVIPKGCTYSCSRIILGRLLFSFWGYKPTMPKYEPYWILNGKEGTREGKEGAREFTFREGDIDSTTL